MHTLYVIIFEVKSLHNNLRKRRMLFKMKKVRSILMLSLIICIAALFMTACGKAKVLTDAASTAAPTTPVDSPCSQDLTSLLNNNSNAAATVKNWASPPDMAIDVTKTYCAIIQTNKGSITLQMF